MALCIFPKYALSTALYIFSEYGLATGIYIYQQPYAYSPSMANQQACTSINSLMRIPQVWPINRHLHLSTALCIFTKNGVSTGIYIYQRLYAYSPSMAYQQAFTSINSLMHIAQVWPINRHLHPSTALCIFPKYGLSTGIYIHQQPYAYSPSMAYQQAFTSINSLVHIPQI